MFGSKRAVRRFSLLLLDEGESYVKDLVASCEWPSEVTCLLLGSRLRHLRVERQSGARTLCHSVPVCWV